MIKLKTIGSLLTITLLASPLASASTTGSASLVAQFNSCASEAIAAQQISVKNINVELPSLSEKVMDHDSSTNSREYVMELVNPQTGKTLSTISCRVSAQGTVDSIKLLSKR